jgi:HSP20 family protein
MAKEAQETQDAQSSEPNRNEKKREGIERREWPTKIQRGSYGANPLAASPFLLMRRFSEDIDRLFGSFFEAGPQRWGDWPSDLATSTFWPNIEVQHAGDKLLIHADVPGLKKEDLNVEVRDHELCISGERRSESERSGGDFYRTERSYGSFCRTVPLPEGAKPSTASATFENGVLKIEIEAPGSGAQAQGRRVEVREGSTH